MAAETSEMIVLAVELGCIAVLLLMSALFSSSETSLFSLTRSQLEELRQSKDSSYGLIQRMLNEPRRLIITVLIGNELVNITISVVMASLIIRMFGEQNSFLNLLVVTPLLLIFGEITPKTLAIKNNLIFAKLEAPIIQKFAQLTTPVREAVRFVSDGIITLIVGKKRTGASLVTEDMVLTLTSEAVGDGVLQKDEAHYIRQIFKFGESRVEDVMTPRSNVHFLAMDATPEQVITQIKASSYSKLPVYKDDQDNVVGVLFGRDLIQGMTRIRGKKGLKPMLREPYFVPGTRQVIDLFHHFRSQRISMALVLDEYGGVTGLVTMDDLLRCIFGDLPSVSGEKQAAKRKNGKPLQTLDATMPVTEFNRLYKSRLPTTICNTINGLVMHYHGELPGKGTQINIENHTFTVMSMTGNRINQLKCAPLRNKKPDAPEKLFARKARQQPATENKTKTNKTKAKKLTHDKTNSSTTNSAGKTKPRSKRKEPTTTKAADSRTNKQKK